MSQPKSIFGSFLKRRYSDTAHETRTKASLTEAAVPNPKENPALSPPTAPKPDPDGHGSSPLRISLPDPIFKTPQRTQLSRSLSSEQVAGRKRALGGFDDSTSHIRSEPSRKKLRQEQELDKAHHSSKQSGQSTSHATPPSPLFFSHSVKERPNLPPRFSSSEAGAKMLSKAKGEDSGVRTVTMARASYLTNSPPGSSLGRRSRTSNDVRSNPAGSPDGSDASDQSRALAQIGIIELLDQDDRPSFIVDLSDPMNHGQPALHLIYANQALRACGVLLDSITSDIEHVSSNPLVPKPISQFKDWVLGEALDYETLGTAQPAFLQGAMSWSCSTLRRRFRIVRGTLQSQSSAVSSATGRRVLAAPFLTVSSASSTIDSPERAQELNKPPMHSSYQEPQDYFGSAGVQPQSLKAESSGSEIPESVDTAVPDPRTPLEISRMENFIAASPSASTDAEALGLSAPAKEVGFFDWTRLASTDDLPPHIQFARSVDWTSTALGPIETWSDDLRQMCNLIMASPHPAAMYWGPDLVAIYNEAYVFLAGQKHPQLMGQSYAEAWAEIWDEVKDAFAGAQKTGQATMKDDDCLFIKRNDFLEETYFSWSIIPMVGKDGSVVGLYNPAFEKTRRKIAERRMLTLREVGERTGTARDIKGFWEEVLAALECNEYDTPFVLIYSLADEDTGDESSVTSSSISGTSKQCYLEGSLGVPENHEAAPESVDLRTGTEGFVPVFREVMKTNRPSVLDVTKGELPERLLEGMDTRGFGDPARAVVVCPIHPTTGESTLGFLVMGINPRRPYDDDYSLFVQLLSRQLATSLASVVLFEEEIKRGQRAAKLAALDRIELSEQLAARTQEAIESEMRFSRMAEFAPVGMFIADSTGHITYCNDTWYEISRVPKDARSTDKWMDYVVDEDKAFVRQVWREMVENIEPATGEFRFKAQWTDRNGTQGDTWVLFSASPEKSEFGSLKSVFGSITNISQQKWAEGMQKRKMEEAVELKRQQENFIDITSHEMRNPLSAILQCADEIVTSLSEARDQGSPDSGRSIFEGNIDAAQTIALCAHHQKRIVDDILTLSKLDSALLMVTPVDVQPLTVVQRALKMFEGELQNAEIHMDFIVDPSFKQLDIDWVKCDPSRVLQVLINLTTNAIKFTMNERSRTIAVTISASRHQPSKEAGSIVSYIPPRPGRHDMTKGQDWGTGEELYIHFSVQDTGRGLSEDEKKSLFLRFSQASPRTHVQYGGSGLGLFISRELTELQGGEIGVASEAGQGSTFAFYIKSRRSTAPENPSEQLPSSLGSRRVSDGRSSLRKAPSAPKARDFAPITSADTPEPREPLKILIVEDNIVNQRVLKKQLTKLGCVVHVANHGAEALDRLRESKCWEGNREKSDALDLRVILMDQEMPVMDGITCTKRIRELEAQGKLQGHVPIVAVTANARQEQVQDALEAGMDDVVSKPFRIVDLIPKIEELTAKYGPTLAA